MDALLSRDAKQPTSTERQRCRNLRTCPLHPNVGIQVESWSLKLCRVLPQRLMGRESPVRTHYQEPDDPL